MDALAQARPAMPAGPSGGESHRRGPRVLLVDDHPLWRETVRQVLEQKGVARTVVEAATAEDALDMARSTSLDVVIMDLDLPGANGVEATARLLEQSPHLRVLVLSGLGERRDVVAAVRAGAAGYLLKTAGAGEIADAVRRLGAGELVFPATLSDVVLAELRSPGERATQPGLREARLEREGDVWAVATDDEVVRVRDTKGLHYLAILLVSPGREHHVSDLLLQVDGASATPGSVTRDDALSIATELGGTGPILDAAAKAAYRKRILELTEDLQEAEAWADLGRAARARAELDALTDQLSAAVGLGGRDRKTGAQSERQRVRVTKAIRTAIKRVAESAPALGTHLDAAVRTGSFCAYAPPESQAVSWTVRT